MSNWIHKLGVGRQAQIADVEDAGAVGAAGALVLLVLARAGP
jgi:hypothetical protein